MPVNTRSNHRDPVVLPEDPRTETTPLAPANGLPPNQTLWFLFLGDYQFPRSSETLFGRSRGPWKNGSSESLLICGCRSLTGPLPIVCSDSSGAAFDFGRTTLGPPGPTIVVVLKRQIKDIIAIEHYSNRLGKNTQTSSIMSIMADNVPWSSQMLLADNEADLHPVSKNPCI